MLWVAMDNSSPHPYLVESCRRAGSAVREIRWAEPLEDERSFGQVVEFGRRTGQEHPMSVKVVSPRLLRELARAPEDVLVIYELGLVGLYAGLSKLFRPHKVVSLVEGDYRHIGRTGSGFLKVIVRRLAARLVDVFVANNAPARDYLIRTLNVPEEKIIVGWWLAGMPADLAAHPPAVAPEPRGGAAVRLRRPAHPSEGHRPADPRTGGLPAAVRPLRPVDHRRRTRTRAPGPAQPSS